MTTKPDVRLSPPPRVDPGGSPWLMLIVLLAGQFMALLDVTIVNVAMPTMRADLHTSGSALQLIVAGYTVSYAMLLITGARLGDLFGRRRTYLVGLLLFTVTSLAWSPPSPRSAGWCCRWCSATSRTGRCGRSSAWARAC